MFGRFLVSVLLIAVGIASPCLVRDCLEWRFEGGEKIGIYQELSDFPQAWKARFPGELGPKTSALRAEESWAELKPYPLAERTMRLLEGVLPSRDSGFRGLPSDPMLDSAESSTARAAAKDALVGADKALATLHLSVGDPVFLRLFKEENELEVWMRGRGNFHYTLYKVYRLKGWSGKLGPKLKEGDRQVPEGFYYVSASRMRPETPHFLGVDLGFPNEYDTYHGRTGSGLLIHGGKNDSGAFILSSEDMSEVYALSDAALQSGQRLFRVNVFPFRMTDKRMEQEWKKQPEWIDFWMNLKEGYDFFENANFPPDVSVNAGDYAFRFPRP